MTEQIYNGDWKEFCKIQRINPKFEHGTKAYTYLLYNGRKCQISCSESNFDSDHLWLTITKEESFVYGELSPYEPYIAPSDDVELLIENDTDYSNHIQQIPNLDFNTIRELSVRKIKSFSSKKQQVLFWLLGQGTMIIGSHYPIEHFEFDFGDLQEKENRKKLFIEVEEDEGIDDYDVLDEYMFAYGKMHQAKLDLVFQQLSDYSEFYDNIFSKEEINIIDYGCGQALGTMCYADYLKKHCICQKVKTIALIEPSVLSLKRAALHASLFFPNAKIITINKEIHELTEDDIIFVEGIPTLHIFSNVLDVISDYEINNLSNIIRKRVSGFNQFICVAPLFKEKWKDDNLSYFYSCFGGENVIEGKREKYKLVQDENWTCNYSCFSTNTIDDFCYSSIDNAEHQYNRGLRYKNGYEYERDPQKAFECFKNSAKLECAKAQYELGMLYAKGIGTGQDYTEAIHWYTKSAEHGCEDAQCALGICYINGNGVEKNLFKAYNLLKQASNYGNKKASLIISAVDDSFTFPKNYSLMTKPIPYIKFKEKVNQGLPLIFRKFPSGIMCSLVVIPSKNNNLYLIPAYFQEIPSSQDNTFAQVGKRENGKLFFFLFEQENIIHDENDLPF